MRHVHRVDVPARCAKAAQEHLQAVGRRGYEGMALWVGKRHDSVFVVEETIIPKQQGHKTALGVYVEVAGDELHRINVWLYEHEMELIAQLHSHPTEAYHSSTDDEFPIATTVGSVSIVLPNYAVDPFVLENCAVYRLSEKNVWEKLTRDEAEELINVIE